MFTFHVILIDKLNRHIYRLISNGYFIDKFKNAKFLSKLNMNLTINLYIFECHIYR